MKNRFLDALIKLILFSAVIHLLILAVIFAVKHDLTVINYFNILNIDYFFPGVDQGFAGQVFSGLTIAALYGIMFLFNKKKK